MHIIDLDEQHQPTYFNCLEDWTTDIQEAGNHKQHWFSQMKDKGLRVKLAVEDDVACGMIQYAPIEHSHIDGRDLYFIYCIWVHGHKQGIGDRRGKGMGQALLHAAEEDAKILGAKGIAAWGIMLPFFMRAAWFKEHGYKKTDRDGIAMLLWKPFTTDAQPPKWIRKKKNMSLIENRVNVAVYVNGWCPAQNLVYERAKRAALELGEKVHLHKYDTLDPDIFNEWGISDGLFIDGKQVRTGPPPSYEKIRGKIAKRVRKLKAL